MLRHVTGKYLPTFGGKYFNHLQGQADFLWGLFDPKNVGLKI